MPEELRRGFSKRHEQITAELERQEVNGKHRTASPEGLTEQASTFTRREVLCALGRELPADVAGDVGPSELERLADRFLAERAVSVMGEHAIGERRYATPELLEVERRLIDAAVSRAGEQTGVCSHDTLRAALAANSTIGVDQAAMVRDITQGGQGVSVVVGKAGTGKTYALGVARHAWQLEGYRVLGAAPTGIATVCLDAAGFEHSRTVDALLGELDQEHADRRRRPRQRPEQLTRTSPLRKGLVSMLPPARPRPRPCPPAAARADHHGDTTLRPPLEPQERKGSRSSVAGGGRRLVEQQQPGDVHAEEHQDREQDRLDA